MSVVSDQHWPLLVVVMPPTIDTAYMAKLTAELDTFYARRQHFVSLMDMSPVREAPSATIRRDFTTWLNRRADAMGHYSLASGIVITNPLVRGAITALQWVFPTPRPTKIFGTPYEATTFLIETLERHAIAFPPSVRRYHESLRSRPSAAV